MKTRKALHVAVVGVLSATILPAQAKALMLSPLGGSDFQNDSISPESIHRRVRQGNDSARRHGTDDSARSDHEFRPSLRGVTNPQPVFPYSLRRGSSAEHRRHAVVTDVLFGDVPVVEDDGWFIEAPVTLPISLGVSCEDETIMEDLQLAAFVLPQSRVDYFSRSIAAVSFSEVRDVRLNGFRSSDDPPDGLFATPSPLPLASRDNGTVSENTYRQSGIDAGEETVSSMLQEKESIPIQEMLVDRFSDPDTDLSSFIVDDDDTASLYPIPTDARKYYRTDIELAAFVATPERRDIFSKGRIRELMHAGIGIPASSVEGAHNGTEETSASEEGKSSPSLDLRTKIGGWVALSGVAANEDFADHSAAIGVRGRIRAEAYLGSALSMALEANGASDRNLGFTNHTTWIREGWLQWSSERMDLKIGRQFLPEGRSDMLRPQVQLSPRDYTQIAINDSEQRIGLPAIRLDLYPSDRLKLTAAAVRQDRNDYVAHSLTEGVNGPRPLEHDPADAALVRIEYQREHWETGAAYTKGHAPSPALDIYGVAHSYPQSRYAIDGSATVGKQILRWDVAWIQNDAAAFPGLPRNQWYGSLGYDAVPWANAFLTLQLVHHHSQLPSSQGLRLLESYNQRFSQTFRRRQTWLTADLTHTFNAKHEMKMAAIVGNHKDYSALLRYSWVPVDRWKVNIQAGLSEGALDTLSGNLPPEKILYLELRHYF